MGAVDGFAEVGQRPVFYGSTERNTRKSNVLHNTGKCPYTCALLCFCHEAYSPSAPKMAFRVWRPEVECKSALACLQAFLHL